MRRHHSLLMLSAMLVMISAKAIPKQESENSNGRLLNLGLNLGLNAGLNTGLGVNTMTYPYSQQTVQYETMEQPISYQTIETQPDVIGPDVLPPNLGFPGNTVPLKDQYMCFPVSFLTAMFPFGAMGQVAGGSNQAELQLGLTSAQLPNFIKEAVGADCDDQVVPDAGVIYTDPGAYSTEYLVQQPQMYSVTTTQQSGGGLLSSIFGKK